MRVLRCLVRQMSLTCVRDGRRLWWTYTARRLLPQQATSPTVSSTIAPPISLRWPFTQTAVAPSRTWPDTHRPLPDSTDTATWPQVVGTTSYRALPTVFKRQQTASGYSAISGESPSAAVLATVRPLATLYCVKSVIIVYYARRQPRI